MHGCGLCGVPIQHRTPIADEDDPEDSLDNNIETSTTLPKSRHESVESPPVSVTPEPESHDQHERQAAPCTICENRRQAAKVTCKNGCEVFTCNSCAHKHKKCFMCNAKLVKVSFLDARTQNTRALRTHKQCESPPRLRRMVMTRTCFQREGLVVMCAASAPEYSFWNAEWGVNFVSVPIATASLSNAVDIQSNREAKFLPQIHNAIR